MILSVVGSANWSACPPSIIFANAPPSLCFGVAHACVVSRCRDLYQALRTFRGSWIRRCVVVSRSESTSRSQSRRPGRSCLSCISATPPTPLRRRRVVGVCLCACVLVCVTPFQEGISHSSSPWLISTVCTITPIYPLSHGGPSYANYLHDFRKNLLHPK